MRILRTASLVALCSIVLAGGPIRHAHGETDVRLQIAQLRAELAKGVTPTVPQGVIDLVLDVTREDALKRNCAEDRFGKPLAPNGEWEDADWYGKAYPEKTGLTGSDAKRDKSTYRRKLSWKSGFCYLTVMKSPATPWPSAARAGAKARASAALKRIK